MVNKTVNYRLSLTPIDVESFGGIEGMAFNSITIMPSSIHSAGTAYMNKDGSVTFYFTLEIPKLSKIEGINFIEISCTIDTSGLKQKIFVKLLIYHNGVVECRVNNNVIAKGQIKEVE